MYIVFIMYINGTSIGLLMTVDMLVIYLFWYCALSITYNVEVRSEVHISYNIPHCFVWNICLLYHYISFLDRATVNLIAMINKPNKFNHKM